MEDWTATGAPEPEPGSPARRLLEGVFGNSPYLGRLILRDPAFATRLFDLGPDAIWQEIMAKVGTETPGLKSQAELMAALRKAKEKAALVAGIADITGVWGVERVTGALSDFAREAVALTTSHLLRQRMTAGELAFPEGRSSESPADGEFAQGSGYFVLGMGKLGAGELNYSSDIDLIAFYDADIARYTGSRDIGDCFIKLTRDLVKILQTRTKDGYVFRTDLRLRPDAGATAVAISTEAAEYYYQSVGLNWERAAMIKAVPIAGDIAAGEEFLHQIAPFVWRKHLDYAAVADIHAMKTRIHEHHHHEGMGFAGPGRQARPRRHPRDRVLMSRASSSSPAAVTLRCATPPPSAPSRRWQPAAISTRNAATSFRRPIASFARSSIASRWSTTPRPIPCLRMPTASPISRRFSVMTTRRPSRRH